MKFCLDCKQLKSRKGNYCKKCGYKHRSRPKGLVYVKHQENPTSFKKGVIPWNTGKVSPYFDRSIGYMKLSQMGKQVKYHRSLMEKFLGRKLDSKELVHHKNHDKLDNRIENLEIMTRSEHMKYHWKLRREQ